MTRVGCDGGVGDGVGVGIGVGVGRGGGGGQGRVGVGHNGDEGAATVVVDEGVRVVGGKGVTNLHHLL